MNPAFRDRTEGFVRLFRAPMDRLRGQWRRIHNGLFKLLRPYPVTCRYFVTVPHICPPVLLVRIVFLNCRRGLSAFLFLIPIAAYPLRLIACRKGGENNENRKIIFGRFASRRFAGSR